MKEEMRTFGYLCPQCGKTLLKKKGKKPRIYCATEGCGYERVEDQNED